MGPMIPQRFAHNYRTEFATHDWHRKGRETKKWKEGRGNGNGKRGNGGAKGEGSERSELWKKEGNLRKN